MSSGRMRPGVVVALGLALVFSLFFVIVAFALPVSTTTADGTVDTSTTIVEANGRAVLGIVFAPLVASLLVVGMVAMRPRRPVMGPFAWVTVSGVALLGLVGLLSIGIFVLPVAIALAVAVALSRPEPVPAR